MIIYVTSESQQDRVARFPLSKYGRIFYNLSVSLSAQNNDGLSVANTAVCNAGFVQVCWIKLMAATDAGKEGD